MGRVCRETQEWVEEQIEQPIEEWENQQEQRCREEECNWWVLCLQQAGVLARVGCREGSPLGGVTVGKCVTRVVCEVVNVVLDVIGFVITLILSIPIIGGIIRTILNWVTEIVWRVRRACRFRRVSHRIRPRKKMYFGVVVPFRGWRGRSLATPTFSVRWMQTSTSTIARATST